MQKRKPKKFINNNLRNNGYSSIDRYIDSYAKEISKSKQVSSKDLKELGLDDIVIEQLTQGTITPREIATIKVKNEIGGIENGIKREYSILSDTVDAVFLGFEQDTNGKTIYLPWGHGEEYYSDPINQFSEPIANFTELKLMGKTESLDKLKKTFGEEFYDVLETTYREFTK